MFDLETIVAVLGAAAAVLAIWIYGARAKAMRQEVEKERERLAKEAEEQEAHLAARERELRVQAKEEALRLRHKIEEELKQERREIETQKRRLDQREEGLDRKKAELEARERNLDQREKNLVQREERAARATEELEAELERVSGMTVAQARDVLLARVSQEIDEDATKLLRAAEERLHQEAQRRAAKIVAEAIQRCAVDQTCETTVSVVALPTDEMKGRIIGREGRNIRTFEQLTGVDLIVDDTPEAVVISAFDPVRREIARVALEQLVSDGRIHPGRIEEVVEGARRTIEERIKEAGERAAYETGVTGLHPELIRLLGKLQYRTSYGQNVLAHSIEVAHLSGMIAGEIGAKVAVARRAGLLHDIGKALDFERNGPHALLGAEVARSRNENREVVHAIAAHHEDVPKESVEAWIVQSADAISASRPGARRETLEAYLKRLQELEELASGFDGVERVFAIQAGREIRVIVRPERVDDLGAHRLARSMAERIEQDMDYPGQIRVTVIRETRAVEYAK
ncbi:MAG: ribonuclease Y [Armatimonadetes bacterium]|nr:ribonuclease Y [Armatimonadota bacterium]